MLGSIEGTPFKSAIERETLSMRSWSRAQRHALDRRFREARGGNFKPPAQVCRFLIQPQLHCAEVEREAAGQTVHTEHAVAVTVVSRELLKQKTDVHQFH